MTADNAPPADKIDVWRTVGAAYAFIFARPLRLLRLGGWWLALVALWQLWRLLPPPLQPPVIDENAPLGIMAAGFSRRCSSPPAFYPSASRCTAPC